MRVVRPAPGTVTASEMFWLLALGPGQLACGLLLYRASVKRLLAGLAALLGLLVRALEPIWVWTIGGKKPGVIVIGATAANVWLDSRRSTG